MWHRRLDTGHIRGMWPHWWRVVTFSIPHIASILAAFVLWGPGIRWTLSTTSVASTDPGLEFWECTLISWQQLSVKRVHDDGNKSNSDQWGGQHRGRVSHYLSLIPRPCLVSSDSAPPANLLDSISIILGTPPFICVPGAMWWLSSLSCYWSNCLNSDFWLAKLTVYTPSLFFGSQNQLLGMFHRFFCCLVLNNKRVERKSEESGPALHTTRIYLHKINCKSMRINPDYFSILVLNQLKFRMFTHELIFEYGEVSLSARWLLGVGPQWIISIIPSHLNIWSPFS